MPHTPHQLPEEFPDHTAELQSLKAEDPHFAKLCDDYHDINRAIHRAETDLEPTDDLHMTQMRKDRLALKDTIGAALRAA